MHKDTKMKIKVAINDTIWLALKSSKEFAGYKTSRTSKEINLWKDGVNFTITLSTVETNDEG